MGYFNGRHLLQLGVQIGNAQVCVTLKPTTLIVHRYLLLYTVYYHMYIL